MKFKKYNRVEYEKNTLFEVVFQARFPQIYKITTEFPVNFQEKIRQEYPESKTTTPTLPVDCPEELRKAFSDEKAHQFSSEDNNWQISLSKDFIAFACLKEYSNYNEFKQKLIKVLHIFYEIYFPSYFTRIGLRYRNIINKTVLGRDDINVRECIPEYIAPELQGENVGDVANFEKLIVFKDKESKANVAHTLATVTGNLGKYQINNEESYIIDIDCYSDQKTNEVANAITKSDTFNENVRNIFRWSITDYLHNAMGPKSG